PTGGGAEPEREQSKGQRKQTGVKTYRVIRRNVEHATIVAAALKKRVREEGPLQTRPRPGWTRSRGSGRDAGRRSSWRWKGRVPSESPPVMGPPGNTSRRFAPHPQPPRPARHRQPAPGPTQPRCRAGPRPPTTRSETRCREGSTAAAGARLRRRPP